MAFLCLLFLAPAARGDEDELRSLELYTGSQVDSVSVGRSLRPASQTAENITVVTAKEIEALNAHTLLDVLYLVAGVQLEYIRTPGSITFFSLQGFNFNHILVLVDNVPVNNLADNFADIALPVQMIERVEIVKGAASPSWGNALGGVINVITKSPQTDRALGGVISASAGKSSTIDGRTELTGGVDRFGYYLTGGKLRSDGLLPNNMVDLNHFYGKINYDLPRQGLLSVTTAVTDGTKGQLQVPAMGANVNSEVSQLIGTFSVYLPVTDRFSIDSMFRTRRMESKLAYESITGGTILKDTSDEEHSNGGVLRFSYLDNLQRVVAGVDYDHLKVHVSQPMKRADMLNRSDDRLGVYLTDTITLGRFAITPSGRFDHTEISGDQFSPSFGVTYAVTDNTALRGYMAKGYSITSLNWTDSLEKVWTAQAGAESADVPYLWMKGTLFYNETGNILTAYSVDGTKIKQRQVKQGIELEVRTLPVFYTSLSASYTFVDARDRDTDAVVKDIARHTVNFGIKYEDRRHNRVHLTGHYIDWNGDPKNLGKYSDVIFDLHLAKRFIYSETVSAEIFGSVRNLFNGDQYKSPYYKNPGRWAEVGIGCTF